MPPMLKIGRIYYPLADLQTIEERGTDIVVRLRGHDPIVLSGDEAKAVLAQVNPPKLTTVSAPVAGLKEQPPAK